MRTSRRVRVGLGIGGAAFAVLVLAGAGRADVTTDRPGSIVILPKVVADGTRDTVVQISNTSNGMARAHCYYLNGAPGAGWQEVDFFITLTRQQPTHWVASRGRPLNPTDGLGSDGAGIDPGLIPPVPLGFTGELVCAQVDGSDFPTGGNALKGEATLLGPDGDVAKYNSINVIGIDVQQDPVLALDNAEYNACPEELVFTHVADGAEDPNLGPGSSVTSRLTLVPCTQDFENGVPARVSATVAVCNEFEECLSGDPLNFDCWYDADLSGVVFQADTFGPFKYTKIRPSPVCVGGLNPGAPCSPGLPDPGCTGGTCDGVVGLLGVLQSTHTAAGGAQATGVQSLHTRGSVPGAAITLVQ